ncbi:serine hydrolase [Cellulomonas sp. URHD0024]|uniref:serine hydrolase domain-containing protein n=1 Tax=Cellulomonas sp. URHD0024 TaxID=1302620 RepID=UPI00068615B6|nr:serine hydrolase [Cellulomonas sp. URHD0024]
MPGRRRLPRSSPQQQGVDAAALADVVRALTALPELHSIMVLRHGHVVAEGWASPYAADRLHEVYSLSKSVTSTAVGFAVDEGLFGVDDLVLDLFRDRAPDHPDEHLRRMRVRHLLTMTTGHDQDPSPAVFPSGGDWVTEFLRHPVEHEPGTHFLYNTAGSYMLSALVQQVTGQRLLDYLQPRLFGPLGIEDVTWEQSPTGVDTGGFGLSATTEDIAAIGLLYLQDGVWEGRQLLPDGWAAEATRLHVLNGDDPDDDWAQGYGYQFWRCRPANSWRGDGAFGQYMIGLPEHDVVVATTAGRQDMHDYLQVLWDRLLPGLSDEPSAASDPEGAAHGQYELAEAVAAMRLDPPQGEPTSPTGDRLSGRTISFAPNAYGLRSVVFAVGTDQDRLILELGDQRIEGNIGRSSPAAETADVGHGSPTIVRGSFRRRNPEDVLLSGTWTAPDIYVLTARFVESPFCLTATATVDGDAITVTTSWNASFGPRNLPPFRGTLT